jgi:hypothetical protein
VQLGERAQQHWNLPKAKQSRNIRKSQGALRPHSFYLDQFRKPVCDHSRDRNVFVGIDGHIRPSHNSDFRKPVERLEAVAEPQLDFSGFARSHIPPMQAQRLRARTLIGSE